MERDPRMEPGTGDIVKRAGRSQSWVPVYSDGFSAVFGRNREGPDSVGYVTVHGDCSTCVDAERRILKRRGLSLRFKSLADWRREMEDAEVVAVNDDPAYTWHDTGMVCHIKFGES